MPCQPVWQVVRRRTRKKKRHVSEQKKMKLLLLRLCVVLLCVLLMDVVWLYIVNGPRYARMIEAIQKTRPKYARAWAGLTAQALVAIGLTQLCLKEDEWSAQMQMNCFLYGLCAFGIYNGTNLFAFEEYAVSMAAVDTLYGTIMCGAVGFGVANVLKN